MKISKLFHWLYAILMFLPFGLLIYNAFASMWSGNIILSNDYDVWFEFIYGPLDGMFGSGILQEVYDVFKYLIFDIFGLCNDLIIELLAYWTCISIIWLVFDVFMYVPLLVHKWIDRAKVE